MLTNADHPQGPPISSEECPQECRSSADSYSPSNRMKRRSVITSVDPDNGDLFINHKHATSNGKRQKYTRTLSETFSTSNGKAKIFPSLREQREQLPIARGRESLIRSIASNNVVIVLGETGSGKSTPSSIPARGWYLPRADRRHSASTCRGNHSRHSRLS
ncbi:hypothetical protein EDB92DRAFT_1203080 [Lactarius akahatsu]|uniref:Uncharacterized protein n=1 Tax=Lactarius akahatsu TaxID=416441 RepID=A0AAD4QBS4_9AGAM|nr:hypothetical protein EDB92DRAFT_1203080 [Lactarius akahatsu]